MSAVVHLVRHGEVFNPDHVLYGRLPGYRLSDLGVEQARRTAEHLRGRDVTVLRTSPLERARQTGEPIAEVLGLTPDVDDRLIEAGNRLEGRRIAGGVGILREPRVWPYLVNPLRPSWGEPYRDIADRVLAAVRDAADAADGHEAVLVSHQLPIVAVRRLVEGQRLWHDPRHRQCALASVTSLTVEGRDVVDVAYAEPAGSTPGAVPGA